MRNIYIYRFCWRYAIGTLIYLRYIYKILGAQGLQNMPAAFLPRGKTPPPMSVLDMTLDLRRCGFNPEVLGNVEHHFIAITPMSLLIRTVCAS